MKEDTIDDKQTTTSLRTLERGLDVLDCFCQGVTRLSLTEIAAKTGLNPSTAFRILATLENRNYISRSAETKKYHLGSQILRLFPPSLESFDLRSIAAPYLQQLNNQSTESVSLYVVLDSHRVCLDRIETSHPLRRVIHIGDRLPLTRGAAGKVLLAWLPADEKAAFLTKDPSVSIEELETIKRQNVSVSIGEREAGVAAIATPIFDANGQVVAALSMSGPTVRFTPEFVDSMIPLTIETGKQISQALGYQPAGCER